MPGATVVVMDEILMLFGEVHHCRDCGADTLFVPVPDDTGDRVGELVEWCCTACDAAVVLGSLSAGSLRRAA